MKGEGNNTPNNIKNKILKMYAFLRIIGEGPMQEAVLLYLYYCKVKGGCLPVNGVELVQACVIT